MIDPADELETVELTVVDDDEETELTVERGENLRRVLLDEGFDVYGPVSKRLNCGGRGLCSTCTVCIEEGAPPPEQWHDDLAVTLGYPRLSCQISLRRDARVRIIDKLVWGQVLPRRYDPDADPENVAGVCAER